MNDENELDRLRASEKALLEALNMFYPQTGCPVCGGDCSSANPPVVVCPMLIARAAIAQATERG
jgi:hypothetical protein